MDTIGYAEATAALVNADLADGEALRRHLADRAWLAELAQERDAVVLRRFVLDLRPVFEADTAAEVVGLVNALLARHPITPQISDHDPDRLHLHVAPTAGSAADQLIGESLLGLAGVVCDLGPGRLGVCAAAGCEQVFVDTSPNSSRRYCSDRCSSRANVAAYRARQRAAIG